MSWLLNGRKWCPRLWKNPDCIPDQVLSDSVSLVKKKRLMIKNKEFQEPPIIFQRSRNEVYRVIGTMPRYTGKTILLVEEL
jgi:hypothetical protein